MKNRILVALSTFGEYGREPVELLEKSGFPVFINPLKKRLSREEILKMGRNCEGVVAGVEIYDRDVLGELPDLRCISRCGVGLDNIDLKVARERGIKIFNTPSVVVQPVAELTVAMILGLCRKLALHTAWLRNGRWDKEAGYIISGKSLGVIGLGQIGKKVCELMAGLGCKLYCTDPYADLDWAKRTGAKIVPLHDLLNISDIITIHVSDSPNSRFLLGRNEFSLMKKGVIIINTARGRYIDEDALYEALVRRDVESAALDVYPEEPYKGKLCGLENVILAPHIGTLTKESRLQMETEAVSNLIDFFNSGGL
jgi:D-3-phosphoglycerate dehydrogenase